ncbi:hypothetical protein E3N88_45844 [Mikania micrantha]|uniref:Uncharacterized protein n=1 Tax=Mikania micrantha TaxID=192012 RepID=A0A5N6L814_9ASTR|nr:hypothetical protein E3N88_45844 [Mikania micrantha]
MPAPLPEIVLRVLCIAKVVQEKSSGLQAFKTCLESIQAVDRFIEEANTRAGDVVMQMKKVFFVKRAYLDDPEEIDSRVPSAIESLQLTAEFHDVIHLLKLAMTVLYVTSSHSDTCWDQQLTAVGKQMDQVKAKKLNLEMLSQQTLDSQIAATHLVFNFGFVLGTYVTSLSDAEVDMDGHIDLF